MTENLAPEEIPDNILTKEKFAALIEDLVWDEDITYIEALLKFQEKNELDEINIKELMDKTLYDKVYREAVDSKQLKENPVALDC